MPPKNPKDPKGPRKRPSARPRAAKRRSRPEAVSSEDDQGLEIPSLDPKSLPPAVVSELRRAIREEARDPSERLQVAMERQVVHAIQDQGLTALQAVVAVQNVMANLLNVLVECSQGNPEGPEEG